jgi:cell division protein FtsB
VNAKQREQAAFRLLDKNVAEVAKLRVELDSLRKIASYRAEDKAAFDALQVNRNEIEAERDALRAEVDRLSYRKPTIDELARQLSSLTAERDEWRNCSNELAECVNGIAVKDRLQQDRDALAEYHRLNATPK